MSKSRSYSIYLLKSGWNGDNSLKEENDLALANNPIGLPPNSKMFLFDTPGREPWWKAFFGLEENLTQALKGALLFVDVGDRCFAFAFGLVAHHLNDLSYEYDFGLKITLNSLDPKELKSTDTVEPGMSRRRRTQVPVSRDLTYLDFDRDSEIMRSITGKVKSEYKKIFKSATGSSSLKVTLSIEPNEIPEVCTKLLVLYNIEDYKSAFPDIQKIIPLKDPAIIQTLNAALVEKLSGRGMSVALTIPDIIDYRDKTCCLFKGNGETSDVYPEIEIGSFYEFFEETRNINEISVEDLKSYKVHLTSSEGIPAQSYSVYRSLVYDHDEGQGSGAIYHLSEGTWYKVEKEYAERVKSYLDGRYEDSVLPPYDHDVEKDGKNTYSEENYNQSVAHSDPSYICLDRKNISPEGQTQVEPCDLYTVSPSDQTTKKLAVFYHVKISTDSSQLSHLFNQGANSVELIKSDDSCRDRMVALVNENIGGNNIDEYVLPIHEYSIKVVFAIITRKATNQKSDSLPLFSRISLMRVMQRLRMMSMDAAFTFVEDGSSTKASYERYEKINVVLNLTALGVTQVQPCDEQKYPSELIVAGCSKKLRNHPPGTRFSIHVKYENDRLSSHNKWPYQIIG